MKKKTDLHSAAQALGRISTPKKAAAARANGRRGGNPPSGLAPERLLLRRVRLWMKTEWAASSGRYPRLSDIRIIQEDACSLRRECLLSPTPLSYLDSYRSRHTEFLWTKLLYLEQPLF